MLKQDAQIFEESFSEYEPPLTPIEEESNYLNVNEIKEVSKTVGVAIMRQLGEEVSKMAVIPEKGGKMEIVSFDEGIFFVPEKETFIFAPTAMRDTETVKSRLYYPYGKWQQLSADYAVGVNLEPHETDPRNEQVIDKEDLQEARLSVHRMEKDPSADPYGNELPIGRIRSMIAANLGRGNTGGITEFEDANHRQIEITKIDPKFPIELVNKDPNAGEMTTEDLETIGVKLGFVDKATGEEIKARDIDEATLRMLYTKILYGEKNDDSREYNPKLYGPESGGTPKGLQILSVSEEQAASSEDLDEIDAVAGMIDANIMETTPSINIGDEMGLTLGDHIFEAHEAINKALEEKKVKGIRADRDHQKALIHYPHDLLEYQGEQKLVPVIVGPKVMVFTSPMRVHTAGVDESALVAVKEGDKWQAKMFDYKATYDEDYAEGDHVAEQIDNWLKAISAEKS